MMFVSQEKLAVILLYSLFIGMFLGAVYDVFRIRRLAFKTSASFVHKTNCHTAKKEGCAQSIVIFFEDVLFSVISAVVVCVFIFYMNSGQFRGIALVGSFCGFLAYYFTVGKLVMYFSGVIIGVIKFLTNKLFDYILRPIRKSVIFILDHTFVYLYFALRSIILRKTAIKKASVGFNILDTLKKGR